MFSITSSRPLTRSWSNLVQKKIFREPPGSASTASAILKR